MHIGKQVKCLLTNNSVAEGIVEEWLPNLVKLQALDGKSILIIHHPDRDIVLTKIILEEAPEIHKEKPTEIVPDLERQFIEEYNKPSEDDLRVQNLAKLKMLLIKQDKEIISKKLKDHNIEEVRTVQYGY